MLMCMNMHRHIHTLANAYDYNLVFRKCISYSGLPNWVCKFQDHMGKRQTIMWHFPTWMRILFSWELSSLGAWHTAISSYFWVLVLSGNSSSYTNLVFFKLICLILCLDCLNPSVSNNVLPWSEMANIR